MKNKKNKKNSNSNYDWFRNGSSATKKSNSPKDSFKKIFKVLKILMYISLAALSLTGCVQSFVISTGNYSGQGMELYESKANIAPHVVTYQYDETNSSIVLDSKANYWLHDKEDLKRTHDFVKSKGGDMSTWKTENNAVQILGKDGNVLSFDGTGKVDKSVKNRHISYLGSSPIIISESMDNSKTLFNYKPTSEVPMFSINKKTKKLQYINQAKVVPLSNPKHKLLIDELQITVFDLLNKMLLDSPLGKKVTGYISTIPKEGWDVTKEVVKTTNIVNFQTKVENLAKNTGVSLAKSSTTTNAQQADKGTRYYQSLGGSSLGMHLSSKAKLRAIYDWNTAWHLGPFYGLFIFPLSRLTLAMMGSIPMLNGWESLIVLALVTIIIRSFSYLLTFKSTLQQVKQQELNSKKAAIEAKYAPYKGNKQMDQRKRQELAEMFKKEGISPLGSIGSIFLTMPLFLAMWKIISGIPHLKSTNWLGINFSQTSYKELFHGEFQYLPLMLTAAIIQGISLYIPRLLTKRRDKKRINAQQKAALKKANKTQNIMMGVFIFMALIFSAGLQVYWIFGGLFMIGQNVLNHFIIKRQSKRRKEKRIKI